MADQADVETALASIVANALYPDGVAAPSAVGSVCRVYRGLPTSPTLGADLAAGVIHVTVNATGDVKNVTRFGRKWQVVSAVPASLSVGVTGNSATFSGTCVVGQLAGLVVNDLAFPYAVQANDSPPTVASNLAASLGQAGWLVQYAGSSVTLPNAERFTARVVSGAQALQEIKRQTQVFKVTVWCPAPLLRDVVSPVIDAALASRQFIAIADGSAARLIFMGSDADDGAADATLYKRTLSYSAEYPTTLAQIEPAMLFGTANFAANGAFVETLNG
jgi:hypothetical protein